jgi:hypothetical protein
MMILEENLPDTDLLMFADNAYESGDDALHIGILYAVKNNKTPRKVANGDFSWWEENQKLDLIFCDDLGEVHSTLEDAYRRLGVLLLEHLKYVNNLWRE